MKIPLSAINKNKSSYVDPNGFVFEYEDRLYRSLNQAYAPLYDSLAGSGLIDRLVGEFNLVPTRHTDIELESLDSACVLEHERIRPMTYCVEWPPAMLREAALTTLELLLVLLENDLSLQDAYPWNIVFSGTRPVFIDLTSIVEVDDQYIWPAFSQYQAFFSRPLELAANGKGNIARSLLYNNISGISARDYYRNLSFLKKLSKPGLALGVLFDNIAQQRGSLKTQVKHAVKSSMRYVSKEVRLRFVNSLKNRIQALTFAKIEDIWSVYCRDIEESVDREAKIYFVEEIIDRFKPKTVTDLGCNTGCFSVIAARKGAKVISIDNSEACTNALFYEACKENLPITPIVSDVICPTPPFGFLGTQYPGLAERGRSEMLFCLALMHHLHISGRQSFDRIAKLMDSFTTKYLVFEFVAKDDSNNDLIGAGREIDYNLATVKAALSRYFAYIEELDSDRPTRKLILCSKIA
jgi:SAM-dependent methyltransferase